MIQWLRVFDRSKNCCHIHVTICINGWQLIWNPMFLGISTENDSPLHSSTCLKICPLVHCTGILTSFSILYWETGEPLSHNIFLRAFGYIVIPAERGEEKAGEERGSARLAADFCCEINREETLYQQAIRRHGLECIEESFRLPWMYPNLVVLILENFGFKK